MSSSHFVKKVASLFVGHSKALFLTVVILLTLYFYPMFYLRPLDEVKAAANKGQFQASEFVDNFWSNTLLPKADDAIKLAALLTEFGQDPEDTIARYGNSFGVSSKSNYLVTVDGTVTEISEYTISIVNEDWGTTSVVIELGPVFGNIIRDGAGGLDVNNFANTQQFNSLSEAINKRIEDDVQPALVQQAVVGQRISIFGGIELSNSGVIPKDLYLTPVKVLSHDD